MSKQRPSDPATEALAQQQAAVYWCGRLFKNTYTRAGKRIPVSGWSVKIQHQGRRHTFSLPGKTKSAAAIEAKAIYDTIVTEGWKSALRNHTRQSSSANGFPKTDIRYWKEQVLLRRYRFPASGESDQDLSVRIDNGGIGYFFPVGTPDPELAAAKAHQIYWTAVEQGWDVVRRRFSRELIIGFEWCANPILWTYTTVHTLVSSGSKKGAMRADDTRGVLIVETDPDLRAALAWCINQQPGFFGICCDSPEAFASAFRIHAPRLVLVNRSLAGRIGIESPGGLAPIKGGVPALTYSVFVDGDHMFVSTPGGAEGYLLKRVSPTSLLDPLINSAWLSNSADDDPLRSVKAYFKQLLQPRSTNDAPGGARLTPREHEVITLLSKGCVDKEIAHALGISAWTVHGHIKKIFERLQVRTRTEAVVHYLEK